MKPYTITAIFFISLTSCNRFYTPVKIEKPATEVITSAIADNRMIVMHDSSGAYDIYNIRFKEDSINFITGKIEGFKKLYSKRRTKVNYYYTGHRKREAIKKEIHLFTSYPVTKQLNNETLIPLASVNKAEELVFDKKKTTGRHVGTAVILAGAAVIAGFIVASSLSFSVIGDSFSVPLF